MIQAFSVEGNGSKENPFVAVPEIAPLLALWMVWEAARTDYQPYFDNEESEDNFEKLLYLMYEGQVYAYAIPFLSRMGLRTFSLFPIDEKGNKGKEETNELTQRLAEAEELWFDNALDQQQ